MSKRDCKTTWLS